MILRPVYEVGDARLYQAGSKRLDGYEPSDVAAEYRIAMVLNVAPHPNPKMAFYVLTYRHVPFGDNSQFRSALPNIEPAVAEAAATLTAGGNVLTHCYYGVNRSGLVNALIIRDIEKCSGRDALARLRERRRGACGGNDHFVAYLNDLEAP